MSTNTVRSPDPTSASSRDPGRRSRWVLAAALAVGLGPAALTVACTEDGRETRCGGGAPQCCCDLLQENNRYQTMCRAECEDNPDEPERSCVPDTACGI